jgi:hypothetical protein
VSDDFEREEPTRVIPVDLQDELVHQNSDTDPEFKNSEFWFRFQHMEKEIMALKDGYRAIYNIMKIYWDNVEDIPQEHMRIIFSLARDVVEGIPQEYNEITLTT